MRNSNKCKCYISAVIVISPWHVSVCISIRPIIIVIPAPPPPLILGNDDDDNLRLLVASCCCCCRCIRIFLVPWKQSIIHMTSDRLNELAIIAPWIKLGIIAAGLIQRPPVPRTTAPADICPGIIVDVSLAAFTCQQRPL
jgi:hypothetical protein